MLCPLLFFCAGLSAVTAKLLSDCSINNVYKWKTGKCKHLVALTPDGLVTNHALFFKDGADTFRTTAGCSVPYIMALQSSKYQCEYTSRDVFIFQFSGPLSLTILEKAPQTNLHDVGFLDFRPVRIPGMDAELEITRIGMSGALAYELHGPAELGYLVYDHVYQVGKPMGMKRMGWKDYTDNHTFGGFPQMTVNFELSLYQSPEFCATAPFMMKCTGSVDPADLHSRFRSVAECDWAWMAKFDHEFVGREALDGGCIAVDLTGIVHCYSPLQAGTGRKVAKTFLCPKRRRKTSILIDHLEAFWKIIHSLGLNL